MSDRYDLVILGLSLSSSWGNGHATTWRSLVKGLARQDRRVLFLEREQPWYSANRDLTAFPHCTLAFYDSLDALRERFHAEVRDGSAVLVGSFVPDGVEVARWVCSVARGTRAFYDIDTPVTLAQLAAGNCPYLMRDQLKDFDLYFSFTGGPTLGRLQSEFGARRALPLYCSVDAEAYRPLRVPPTLDLGYLGTYSDDRQRGLQGLLLDTARRLPHCRFSVVGAQYPESLAWPANVAHVPHLPPHAHPGFYGSQRFTLNLTRANMISAGYSPSVRLFEAGACEVPVISDVWPGIEEFFVPGMEIFLAEEGAEVERLLVNLSERDRRRVARAARSRVLREHTGDQRARELAAHLGFQVRTPRQPPPLALSLTPARLRP
jgi:spore maturation protein CgeB